MAQIELRNALIRIVDGYTNTALVNDTPLTGDLEVDIDTLGTAGLIPNGARFTVVGNNQRHYVNNSHHNQIDQVVVDATAGNWTMTVNGQTTANIAFNANAATVQAALEALSNVAPGDVVVTSPVSQTWIIEFKGVFLGIAVTTSVTGVGLTGGAATVVKTNINPFTNTNRVFFTPAFVTAKGIPANNAAITFSGRSIEIKIGEGNLTYNEQRVMEYKLNRSKLDTVREGDDTPMEVALDFTWEQITAMGTDSLPTIEDALKKRGLASDWQSSSADACEPYAVDVEIEHIPPCGSQQAEMILLPDYRWESLNHNLRDATVATSGKCNAREAIITREDE